MQHGLEANSPNSTHSHTPMAAKQHDVLQATHRRVVRRGSSYAKAMRNEHARRIRRGVRSDGASPNELRSAVARITLMVGATATAKTASIAAITNTIISTRRTTEALFVNRCAFAAAEHEASAASDVGSRRKLTATSPHLTIHRRLRRERLGSN